MSYTHSGSEDYVSKLNPNLPPANLQKIAFEKKCKEVRHEDNGSNPKILDFLEKRVVDLKERILEEALKLLDAETTLEDCVNINNTIKQLNRSLINTLQQLANPMETLKTPEMHASQLEKRKRRLRILQLERAIDVVEDPFILFGIVSELIKLEEDKQQRLLKRSSNMKKRRTALLWQNQARIKQLKQILVNLDPKKTADQRLVHTPHYHPPTPTPSELEASPALQPEGESVLDLLDRCESDHCLPDYLPSDIPQPPIYPAPNYFPSTEVIALATALDCQCPNLPYVRNCVDMWSLQTRSFWGGYYYDNSFMYHYFYYPTYLSNQAFFNLPWR